ncbi:hypothetical protein HKX48_006268 [Thoreauomyces humboldtii]|nr:hypothetical protein HKX48_006268 [Thoreauomyces humboldtii]
MSAAGSQSALSAAIDPALSLLPPEDVSLSLPATPSTPVPPGTTVKSAAKKKVAVGTQVAKQIIKGSKKGAAQGDFRLDDLDESVLQARLNTLEAELAEYKAKCDRHKAENEWYRTEIESCQRDTAEYILYLESKKSEKQSAIDSLIDGSKKDFDAYLEKKKAKELRNQAKIEALRAQLAEMEEKIEQKQEEVNGLSDVMAHRARHEADIERLQREMQDAERVHRSEIQELERTLLEERIKVQKETDVKIKEMESAAHEKAHGYLTSHIATIDAENEKLSHHLRHLIVKTQQLLTQKSALEVENSQMARDATVRQDIVQLRLDRIAEAERRRSKDHEEKRKKGREVRRKAMEAVAARWSNASDPGLVEKPKGRRQSTQTEVKLVGPQKPGIAEVVFSTSALGEDGTMASLTIEDGDLDWSSEEDDEYL